ncbi:MAG: acyltransferase family protein [Vicinamibacterales bacterium]
MPPPSPTTTQPLDSRTTESYRPDIDGLRAIAVLAVVGYHAFPQWVPGGFVGVDIFFVVSGFLISGQLFAACERGTFSFADFYARRVRRLVPALLVVLVATMVFGWLALLPDEFKSLQRHLAASAFFANNLVLWREAGYFDAPSELKPLLHLWSLGIEEQFYLVWPLLVWWCWRRGMNRLFIIGAVVGASFALNVMLVTDGAAASAFYLPQTRLWQLGAGAWLAALAARLGEPLSFPISRIVFVKPERRDAETTSHALAAIGMALIGLSIVSISRGLEHPNWWADGAMASVGVAVRFAARALWLATDALSYPGWSALAPTVGALLVIAAGPSAWCNRVVLARPGPVLIGLISYPLYLWHWPMLSFLQLTEQGHVSRPMKAAAIGVSMILAWLTYTLLERPIRRSVSVRTPWKLAGLYVPLVIVGIVMLAGLATGTLAPPARTALQPDAAVPISLNESRCRDRFPGLGEYCQQFLDSDVPITTAILGDSHAAHFFPGLGIRLAAAGENLVHLGQTGCPPLLGIERSDVRGDNACVRVNTAALDAVARDPVMTRVVIAFRGALAVTGEGFGDNERSRERFRLAATGVTNADAIRAGLEQTVAFLLQHRKQVLLVSQVPELGFRVDDCTGRPLSWSRRPQRAPCGVPKDVVLARQAPFRALLSDLAGKFPVTVVDPLPILCDAEWCMAIADGRMLYHDDNHLGVVGSSIVAAAFAGLPPANRR